MYNICIHIATLSGTDCVTASLLFVGLVQRCSNSGIIESFSKEYDCDFWPPIVWREELRTHSRLCSNVDLACKQTTNCDSDYEFCYGCKQQRASKCSYGPFCQWCHWWKWFYSCIRPDEQKITRISVLELWKRRDSAAINDEQWVSGRVSSRSGCLAV